MVKKLLVLSGIFILCAALDITSNSAPASSSGAPGETDCTRSGCHSTFAANSGPGNIEISFENDLTNYTPGATYTIEVAVNHAYLTRFGFELVALDGQDQNAGTLLPIDNVSNQVITGYGNMASRKYMTYTYESTQAKIAGQGKWTFKWTAPAVDKGKITFYAAGIAANNNGNDAGDHCYTQKTTLSSLNSVETNAELSVYPNPASEMINLSYTLENDAQVKVELLNALGQKMQELDLGYQTAATYSLPFSLVKEYGKGVYFIRLIENEKVSVKKLMLSK